MLNMQSKSGQNSVFALLFSDCEYLANTSVGIRYDHEVCVLTVRVFLKDDGHTQTILAAPRSFESFFVIQLF